MPFVSAKQRRWMYAKHPAMARRWSAEEKAMRGRLVAKSSADEVKQLSTRKRKQKHFSQASAGLGLTALAAKAPAYAAGVKRRYPKVPVGRLAAMAPKANKVSEHVVPVSLGVGALGSINFARLQGQEAKVVEARKSLVDVASDVVKASWYPNVSTGAERAYEDLGRRKRKRTRDAALYSGLAAWGANEARVVRRVPMSRRARGVGYALSAVPVAAGTVGAVTRGGEALSLKHRRDAIKAKGLERQKAGVLGRDRKVSDYPHLRRETTSKAMPRPRAGGLVRLPTGRTVSRRGALPGSAKYAAAPGRL